ncbi:MAG: hypothetical protein CME65_02455 [Halobacteriovoraceae bacterium]|nr:hypothetical protein [Halobacteriovoraceae bacterium]|tara:strand:+ start:10366 stop:10980 length:615 start_codon:yes stop_codon:yes gene_type:complete
MRTLIALFLCLGLSTAFSSTNYRDGETISLKGEVVETGPDYLVVEGLNPDGALQRHIIEMDDWSSDSKVFLRLKGEKVLVYGRVDNDALEKLTVEASRVYVPRLQKAFEANPVDEEFNVGPFGHVNLIPDFPDKTQKIFVGKVLSVGTEEALVETEEGKLIVDFNNIDASEDAFARGDRLRITGYLNENIFTYDEIDAQAVVKY